MGVKGENMEVVESCDLFVLFMQVKGKSRKFYENYFFVFSDKFEFGGKK